MPVSEDERSTDKIAPAMLSSKTQGKHFSIGKNKTLDGGFAPHHPHMPVGPPLTHVEHEISQARGLETEGYIKSQLSESVRRKGPGFHTARFMPLPVKTDDSFFQSNAHLRDDYLGTGGDGIFCGLPKSRGAWMQTNGMLASKHIMDKVRSLQLSWWDQQYGFPKDVVPQTESMSFDYSRLSSAMTEAEWKDVVESNRIAQENFNASLIGKLNRTRQPLDSLRVQIRSEMDPRVKAWDIDIEKEQRKELSDVSDWVQAGFGFLPGPMMPKPATPFQVEDWSQSSRVSTSCASERDTVERASTWSRDSLSTPQVERERLDFREEEHLSAAGGNVPVVYGERDSEIVQALVSLGVDTAMAEAAVRQTGGVNTILALRWLLDSEESHRQLAETWGDGPSTFTSLQSRLASSSHPHLAALDLDRQRTPRPNTGSLPHSPRLRTPLSRPSTSSLKPHSPRLNSFQPHPPSSPSIPISPAKRRLPDSPPANARTPRQLFLEDRGSPPPRGARGPVLRERLVEAGAGLGPRPGGAALHHGDVNEGGAPRTNPPHSPSHRQSSPTFSLKQPPHARSAPAVHPALRPRTARPTPPSTPRMHVAFSGPSTDTPRPWTRESARPSSSSAERAAATHAPCSSSPSLRSPHQQQHARELVVARQRRALSSREGGAISAEASNASDKRWLDVAGEGNVYNGPGGLGGWEAQGQSEGARKASWQGAAEAEPTMTPIKAYAPTGKAESLKPEVEAWRARWDSLNGELHSTLSSPRPSLGPHSPRPGQPLAADAEADRLLSAMSRGSTALSRGLHPPPPAPRPTTAGGLGTGGLGVGLGGGGGGRVGLRSSRSVADAIERRVRVVRIQENATATLGSSAPAGGDGGRRLHSGGGGGGGGGAGAHVGTGLELKLRGSSAAL